MTETTTSAPPTDDRIQKTPDPDLSKQHIARVIRYETPETTRSRHVVSFGRTDSMMAFMQILLESGETSLHAHPNTDSIWWVVRGKAEFYTTDRELLAELGPEQGVMIPRDYPYAFNAVGSEPLEILQIESFLRQGERLQTVLLEEDRVGEYEVSHTGEYASPPPRRPRAAKAKAVPHEARPAKAVPAGARATKAAPRGARAAKAVPAAKA